MDASLRVHSDGFSSFHGATPITTFGWKGTLAQVGTQGLATVRSMVRLGRTELGRETRTDPELKALDTLWVVAEMPGWGLAEMNAKLWRTAASHAGVQIQSLEGNPERQVWGC